MLPTHKATIKKRTRDKAHRVLVALPYLCSQLIITKNKSKKLKIKKNKKEEEKIVLNY
jgi:hypothetical protein